MEFCRAEVRRQSTPERRTFENVDLAVKLLKRCESRFVHAVDYCETFDGRQHIARSHAANDRTAALGLCTKLVAKNRIQDCVDSVGCGHESADSGIMLRLVVGWVKEAVNFLCSFTLGRDDFQRVGHG
jgi:hypothetical protein